MARAQTLGELRDVYQGFTVANHGLTHPRLDALPAGGRLFGLFGGAELAARHSALDASWVITSGWKRGGDEFRELLEIQRYRTYPDEGGRW